MAFNGAGVFNRLYSWVQDAVNGIKIRADRMDNEDNGFATGLTDCVTRDGQSPALANLPMGGFRHTGVQDGQSLTDYASVNQLQGGAANFAIAAGTAQAITAVFTPNPIALSDGMQLRVRALLANTATAPTFSPNGLTAEPITKLGGAPLVPGDIAGPLHELVLRYNLANTRWELLNPAISSQFAIAAGTAQALTAAFNPAIATLFDGMLIRVRALLANTAAAPTLNVNGLGALGITKFGGKPLLPGDIVGPLHELLLCYNLANTRWELLNPLNAQLVNAGSGPAFTSSGYTRLPGGFIMQWGYQISPGPAGAIINFPIPFPNTLISVQGNSCESGSANFSVSCYPISLTQMGLAMSGGIGVYYASWVAIGN